MRLTIYKPISAEGIQKDYLSVIFQNRELFEPNQK